MTRKSDGLKPSVVRDKSIHRRQVEIGGVGNGFQSPELDAPRLGSLRHGRGFHITALRHKPCQTNFLLFAGHGWRTHQNSLTRTDFGSHTIRGIDHRARLKNIPDLAANYPALPQNRLRSPAPG